MTTVQNVLSRRPCRSTLTRVVLAGSLAAGAALGSVGAVHAYSSPGFSAMLTCVEQRSGLNESCTLVFTLSGPPGQVGGLTVHFAGAGVSANAVTNSSGVATGPVVSGTVALCALVGNSTYTGTVTTAGAAAGTDAQTQACAAGITITGLSNGAGSLAHVPATVGAKVTAASTSHRDEVIAGAGGVAVLALAGTVLVAGRRRRETAE